MPGTVSIRIERWGLIGLPILLCSSREKNRGPCPPLLVARLGHGNLGRFSSLPAYCRLEHASRSHANQMCGWFVITHRSRFWALCGAHLESVTEPLEVDGMAKSGRG